MVWDLYAYANKYCKCVLKSCLQVPRPCLLSYTIFNSLGHSNSREKNGKLATLLLWNLSSLLAQTSEAKVMTALQKHLMGLKTILAQPWRATPRVSVAFWGLHKGGILLHPDPPRHWANGELPEQSGGFAWAPLRAKNSPALCKGKSSIKGGTYQLFWPLVHMGLYLRC